MGGREDIRLLMAGRWRAVLPAFGLSARALSGKHGPCPMCGGRDRFRFDDKERRGTWICSRCGSGDGFDLVASVKGLDIKRDFVAIADRLRRELGDDPPPPSNDARPSLPDDQRKAMLVRLWKASAPIAAGDDVDRYLVARWLGRLAGEYPADLRCCPACEVSGVPGVQTLPAMVALVRSPDGKGATLHRTYLRDGAKAGIDSPKRVMPGSIAEGSAVRLADAPQGGVLGIAEGIETALAATEMWRLPVWAALNSGMLKRWQPPQGVRKVVVLADNDGNFTGQAAAYQLAHRLATLHEPFEVDVWVPPTDGADWSDEWARVCEDDQREATP